MYVCVGGIIIEGVEMEHTSVECVLHLYVYPIANYYKYKVIELAVLGLNYVMNFVVLIPSQSIMQCSC